MAKHNRVESEEQIVASLVEAHAVRELKELVRDNIDVDQAEALVHEEPALYEGGSVFADQVMGLYFSQYK